MRYFLRLAYFGKNFHGWQVQANAPSVQQSVNKALSTLLRQEINVVGAGRTDAGVHAREMYAHFDCDSAIADIPLALNRLNKMVGADIALYELFPVRQDAHARFDAEMRRYEYHISRVKNPFLQDLSAFIGYPLQRNEVEKATAMLLGKRDFSSFSKSNTQTKTNICDISHASWEINDERWVFHVSANRFLRNMVRAIVGSLLEVGRGRMNPAEFDNMIAAKDRRLAGESVPPQGLFLAEINYPKHIFDGRFS